MFVELNIGKQQKGSFSVNFQIGDLVRTRATIELVPLDEDLAPAEIPAGVFGEVSGITHDADGEIYWVEFHEPYHFIDQCPLAAESIELVFRIDA